MIDDDIEKVVDCIIHGLIARYPLRSYEVGWSNAVKFLYYFPRWITEPRSISAAKKQQEAMKNAANK